MGNDKDWQRRSDEWVKAAHESRLRKENRAKKARKTNDQLRDRSVLRHEAEAECKTRSSQSRKDKS